MQRLKSRLLELYVEALKRDVNPETLAHEGLVDQLDIDSISALELLITVEDEFGITIEDEDLTTELIDSVDALARYVLARAPHLEEAA
jgi:acyl carrier protein